MGSYSVNSFRETVIGNSYPGRGIVAGESADGSSAVIAYFIMGRSENSRNRVLAVRNGAVFTEPYDIAKLKDPTLIIYPAVRMINDHLIVTNGNQTDTICDGVVSGKTFYESLETRTFEPDAPNLTPRISAELVFDDKADFIYRMSIIKSLDEEGTSTCRCGFDYEPLPGVGHFIHTYEGDGEPLPPFCGEPRKISVPDDIDTFAAEIWDALDEDNRISLYVRYTDLISGEIQTRIINKNR